MKFYNQEQFLKNGMIQEVIWIEELGELQHEITKSLRGMLNKEHLIEELADVLICLEQLKIKYNISDEELQKWIDYKYNRNCKRQEQTRGMTRPYDAFEVIEAVERWSKEHPPKKIKISNIEYEVLKTLVGPSYTKNVAFGDFGITCALMKKGYFKGANKSMKIKDYLKYCEVESE